MIKKLMVCLMVAAFSFCVAVPGFAAQIVKGTVVKIEGGKLSIMDSAGQEVTVSDPAAMEGLKVGDKVIVKDGKVKVIKEKEDSSSNAATSSELSK